LSALKQGKSLVIEDAHNDPRAATLEEFVFAARGARSLLIVPLLKEEHIAAGVTRLPLYC
jgi:GAF domain-containing protein